MCSSFLVFAKLSYIRSNRNSAKTVTKNVAKRFRVRPCFSKLRSIVLEVDFYSRGSKLFMYVNPFAKRSNRKQNWLNFSVFLNTLNLLLHVTTFITPYYPQPGLQMALIFYDNTLVVFFFARSCNIDKSHGLKIQSTAACLIWLATSHILHTGSPLHDRVV